MSLKKNWRRMDKPKKKEPKHMMDYSAEAINIRNAYNQACDDWQKYHNAVLEELSDVKWIKKIVEEIHKDFKREIPYGANLFYMSLATAISKMIKRGECDGNSNIRS